MLQGLLFLITHHYKKNFYFSQVLLNNLNGNIHTIGKLNISAQKEVNVYYKHRLAQTKIVDYPKLKIQTHFAKVLIYEMAMLTLYKLLAFKLNFISGSIKMLRKIVVPL